MRAIALGLKRYRIKSPNAASFGRRMILIDAVDDDVLRGYVLYAPIVLPWPCVRAQRTDLHVS